MSEKFEVIEVDASTKVSVPVTEAPEKAPSSESEGDEDEEEGESTDFEIHGLRRRPGALKRLIFGE